jgi:threonine synthase
MRYVSTRGITPALNFEGALMGGLAFDGGLYVPETVPIFSNEQIQAFKNLKYSEVAYEVMKPFVGDTFTKNELFSLIDSAYSSFNHNDICPLVKLSDNNYLLELFHGPTLAFKDVAMQIIGKMFETILSRKNRRATIVAATSGDTGSAAMEAFRSSELADIFVLFPQGRVSEVQRRQMTTLVESNIHALSIDGDFDDCQLIVKQMFNDFDFRERVKLTGVNSINWARVLAQTVYFFTAAVGLGAPQKKVSFTVPTGNFGDIFAGYMAKKMGLPIERLIIATNENDILHRTLETGEYVRRNLLQTNSPSMDIQISSNFERLLFDLEDKSGSNVQLLMKSLKEDGKFVLNSRAFDSLKESFSSGRVSNKETLATLKSVWHNHGELVCPHTAVGLNVALRDNINETSYPMVTLATAHPAKFPDAVKSATGIMPKLPDRYFDLHSKKENFTSAKNSVEQVKEIIIDRIVN